MAEAQVLHPSLEGSGYLCCTDLGVLHGVCLEPVLLFLNLGLKVPPKQNWLQWKTWECGWKFVEVS